MADPSDITIRGGALPPARTPREMPVCAEPPCDQPTNCMDWKRCVRAPAPPATLPVPPAPMARTLTPIPMDLPNLPTRSWPPFAGARKDWIDGRDGDNWRSIGHLTEPERQRPDADSKTVASCDDRHQIDAYFIAASREPAPVFLVRFHGETIGGAFATRDSAEADAAKRNGEGSTQGWRVEMYPVAP